MNVHVDEAFLNTIGQYSFTLKWLGRFSLLKDWLSILTLENERKSSGMSITGTVTCCSSFTQWFTPHMNTDNSGSLLRNSFRFGCFTLNRFVLVFGMLSSTELILTEWPASPRSELYHWITTRFWPSRAVIVGRSEKSLLVSCSTVRCKWDQVIQAYRLFLRHRYRLLRTLF